MPSPDLSKLREPFPAKDIEWRVQQSGFKKNGDPYIQVLAYLDNRAIMDRLDEVVGADRWHNDYKTGPDGGVLCGISIKCGDEWVTKWDGASNTDIEGVKGGLSGSMKRAAVQWGIGRYLYDLPVQFVPFLDSGEHYILVKEKNGSKSAKGYWNTPTLPSWALPKAPAKPLEGAKTTATTSVPEGVDPDTGEIEDTKPPKKPVRTMSNADIQMVYTLLKGKGVGTKAEANTILNNLAGTIDSGAADFSALSLEQGKQLVKIVELTRKEAIEMLQGEPI